MKALRKLVDKIKPNFQEGGKLSMFHSVFDGFETFLFVPSKTSKSGTHIHDAVDSKRMMSMVVIALVPALLFGMFNVGYQHFLATGQLVATYWNPQTAQFWNIFLYGVALVLPKVIVSYVVGLGIEFTVAQWKKEEIHEGFLVSGILIPLIVPVDLPLWMLTVAIVFGVIIGKEVFGGTGMNILNPALTIRAFLFFAYPTWMSGDKVWVEGAVERTKEIAAGANLDAISGETILGSLAQSQPVKYSIFDMFYGFIPGSIGETSTLLILLAGLFLIFTKIGSWRIMVSGVIGALVMGFIFNQVTALGIITPSSNFYTLMNLPFWEHLLIGGLAFGIVFMATDPVTAAQTNKGKYIYGFLVGFISIMIRVFNPAYPEGVMLAILLMNVFAPTIDHYVVQGNITKRKKRLKAKTA